MSRLSVQLWSFHIQVLLSHLWELKRKKEGRRDINGKKEGIKEESRKERKKVLKENNNNNKIRNYLKKKKASWSLQTGQANFAGLFVCSRLRVGLVLLFSFLISTQQVSSPVPQQPLVPQLWASTVLGAIRVSVGPSVVPSVSGAFNVCLGPSDVCTLLRALGVGSGPSAPCVAGWGGEGGVAAGGEFLKLPLSVSFFHFFFETFLLPNPAAPYKKGPVLSHSPPLQLDWGLSWSGPNSQLSLAGAHSLHGFTT